MFFNSCLMLECNICLCTVQLKGNSHPMYCLLLDKYLCIMSFLSCYDREASYLDTHLQTCYLAITHEHLQCYLQAVPYMHEDMYFVFE